ncbi:MAG: ABC transporter ATP-binding protein [Deltaproteobacteria bacterium]|nr:ABC transporter ATP-binding protein [Deltaproteobacteria bacterium]
MADREPPLVQAVDVCKWFELGNRRIDVLKGIDFSLYAGDMVGIVGRSGSGKSTLLHLLGTLDAPSRGQILYDGHRLDHLGDRELSAFRNRFVGFVFQFHHLLPEMTAYENVLMPALIARASTRPAHERARDLLQRVGLGDRLDHHPGELSGGEQQRVALARALVMQPKVVLADEPTGNLDGRTAEEMHVLIEELNRETGTAFVVVSHNQELARRMRRVVRMLDGRFVDESEAVSVAPVDDHPGEEATA